MFDVLVGAHDEDVSSTVELVEPRRAHWWGLLSDDVLVIIRSVERQGEKLGGDYPHHAPVTRGHPS